MKQPKSGDVIVCRVGFSPSFKNTAFEDLAKIVGCDCYWYVASRSGRSHKSVHTVIEVTGERFIGQSQGFLVLTDKGVLYCNETNIETIVIIENKHEQKTC